MKTIVQILREGKPIKFPLRVFSKKEKYVEYNFMNNYELEVFIDDNAELDLYPLTYKRCTSCGNKVYLKNNEWKDGVVGLITAEKGSKFSEEQFEVILCDRCIEVQIECRKLD